MAENESLDLKSPYAQRWNAVRDATQKGGSPQEVVVVTKANLKRATRKVLVEFQVCSVTTADFLVALPAFQGGYKLEFAAIAFTVSTYKRWRKRRQSRHKRLSHKSLR